MSNRLIKILFLFLLGGCGDSSPGELTQERLDFKQREFEECMDLVVWSDAASVRACENHASTRDWQQDVVNRNKQ